MPNLKVAYIREQGVDLIIAPLDASFDDQPAEAQESVIRDLTLAARNAGLAGTVVPVWDAGSGRMSFRAPRSFHPFFESLNIKMVLANINKTISW